MATHPDDFVGECITVNPAIAARIMDDLPDAYLFIERRRPQLPMSAERLSGLVS